jgi:predicted DCC family thiol-disulfide oxidoreductase YuxK
MGASRAAVRGVSRALLLYDSDCGFCRWSVDKLLSWDRRASLRPVALQAPEADELLGGMSVEQRMASWHLVTSEGKVYSRGAAAPPLLRMLPGGSPLASVLAAFPGVTERVYGWVTEHRDRLGGLVGSGACSVDPSRRR